MNWSSLPPAPGRCSKPPAKPHPTPRTAALLVSLTQAGISGSLGATAQEQTSQAELDRLLAQIFHSHEGDLHRNIRLPCEQSDFVAASPDEVGPTGRRFCTSECEFFGLADNHIDVLAGPEGEPFRHRELYP